MREREQCEMISRKGTDSSVRPPVEVVSFSCSSHARAYLPACLLTGMPTVRTPRLWSVGSRRRLAALRCAALRRQHQVDCVQRLNSPCPSAHLSFLRSGVTSHFTGFAAGLGIIMTTFTL